MNKFWWQFSLLIIFSIILISSTNKVKYKYFGFFHSLKKTQMQLTKINVTENEEVQKICGQSNSTHTRRVFKIMGGMEAETGQFPWAIALLIQLKRPIKKSKLHLQCTGSLISQKHAIISAHCIMNIHADCMQSSLNKIYEYVIAYGGINLKCNENEMRNCEIPEENSTGHWMEITRATKMFIPMKPIQQNCRNPAYDFVILELEDKIKFDENTKPICIVSNLKNKLNSKIIMDNGWGRDETESHSYVLRYKYGKVLAIIPTNYLESDINNDNKISNTTFEGTIITRGILNNQPNSKLMPTICTGDSGGPLIGQITKENGETRNVLLGIHSQGESSGICHKNSPLMKIPRKISAFDWEAHTFGPSIADQICQWTGVCEID